MDTMQRDIQTHLFKKNNNNVTTTDPFDYICNLLNTSFDLLLVFYF